MKEDSEAVAICNRCNLTSMIEDESSKSFKARLKSILKKYDDTDKEQRSD